MQRSGRGRPPCSRSTALRRTRLRLKSRLGTAQGLYFVLFPSGCGGRRALDAILRGRSETRTARAAVDENAKRWARSLGARGVQHVGCVTQQWCRRRVRPQPRDIQLVSLGDHALLTSASILRPIFQCARGFSLWQANQWLVNTPYGEGRRRMDINLVRLPRASYTLARLVLLCNNGDAMSQGNGPAAGPWHSVRSLARPAARPRPWSPAPSHSMVLSP